MQIEGMGAQITGVYSELFNGFAFKTQDNQSAEEIVRFLEASLQVSLLLQIAKYLSKLSKRPSGVKID